MSAVSEAVREKITQALDRGAEVEEALREATPEAGIQSRMRAFALLEKWKRELDDALKACKREIEKISPSLAEEMVLAGIESQRTEGLTIYMKDELYVNKVSDAEGVTTADVCNALNACGLGYMVTDSYQPSSLKSKIKEWLDEGHEIPEPLQRVLKISTATRLCTRK